MKNIQTYFFQNLKDFKTFQTKFCPLININWKRVIIQIIQTIDSSYQNYREISIFKITRLARLLAIIRQEKAYKMISYLTF